MSATQQLLNVRNRSGTISSPWVQPSTVAPAGTNYVELLLTGGSFTDPATAMTARIEHSYDGGVTAQTDAESGWIGGDTAPDHQGNTVLIVPKLGTPFDTASFNNPNYRLRATLVISGTVRCGVDATFYP